MAGNAEFELGDEELSNAMGSSVNAGLGIDDEALEAAANKPAATGKKQKPPKIKADVTLTEERTLPPTKQRLVKIMIDEVKGMSNYETVSPNGIVYKIKRGVPVDVPQEVVNALELCVMTHIEEVRDPVTGERVEKKKTFSAIPWRKL